MREMTVCCGSLTGIVIAYPLELRIVNFDPRSGGPAHKLFRYALSIGIMIAILLALHPAFIPFAGTSPIARSALDYLRYAAADFAGMFLAPFLFCKMKLAVVRPAS